MAGFPDIRAVIFDMDGVLLDSEPLHHAAMNAVLASYGYSVEDAEFSDYIGDSSENAWRAVISRRALPGDLADWVARYGDAVCAVISECGAPMPGLQALLEDLRQDGIPMAVASSSPMRWVETSLDRIGVRSYFRALVGGEMLLRPKPAPEVFLRAALMLGVQPSGCLVIEDSPRGLEAAREARMFVVALQPGWSYLAPPLNPPDADLVVNSLVAFHAWWRSR
ncbi:MAG: HAD family hydrolase [Chloroflexia bacterium]